MIDVGIIGAMAPEVEELISLLGDHRTARVSGVDYHEGFLEGKHVVVAQCGIGKVYAATSCEAMILRYSPRLIVNTGVAGALAKDLVPGDTVIADRLCQHDMDTTPVGDPKGLISGTGKIYFDTDPRSVKILTEEAAMLGMRAQVGIIASGDQFIASREERDRIIREFSASACEMEGGAIAQTCYLNSTPCVVIRAISDSADGEASVDYPTFLASAAKKSAALTRALVRRY